MIYDDKFEDLKITFKESVIVKTSPKMKDDPDLYVTLDDLSAYFKISKMKVSKELKEIDKRPIGRVDRGTSNVGKFAYDKNVKSELTTHLSEKFEIGKIKARAKMLLEEVTDEEHFN